VILQRLKEKKGHKGGERRRNLEICLNPVVKMEMQNPCMKPAHSADHVYNGLISLSDIFRGVTVVIQAHYKHWLSSKDSFISTEWCWSAWLQGCLQFSRH